MATRVLTATLAGAAGLTMDALRMTRALSATMAGTGSQVAAIVRKGRMWTLGTTMAATAGLAATLNRSVPIAASMAASAGMAALYTSPDPRIIALLERLFTLGQELNMAWT